MFLCHVNDFADFVLWYVFGVQLDDFELTAFVVVDVFTGAECWRLVPVRIARIRAG